MATALSLAELQEELKKSLKGVQPCPKVVSLIRTAPPLSAHARLKIYTDGFWLRQLDALGSDFRLVRLILGDEGFAVLAQNYVKAHPSHSTTLGDLGRKLPEFVRRRARFLFPDLAETLRDVALLEWLAVECFYAEVHATDIPKELALIPPERLGEVQFQLSPSLRRIESRVRLDRFWGLASAESCPSLKSQIKRLSRKGAKRHYLIWRKGFQVQVRELSPAEARLLSQIERGVCFGRLKFPNCGSWETVFGSWVEEGILAAIGGFIRSTPGSEF